jgi:hypothetical protein
MIRQTDDKDVAIDADGDVCCVEDEGDGDKTSDDDC